MSKMSNRHSTTSVKGREGMEAALIRRDHTGVQDFVLLEDFTNIDAFIDNLRKRFKENLIYTYIGPVLVSVNPYKTLDIYNEKVTQTYRNVNFYELPPHIFAIGDAAYHSVKSEFVDQCVLISGESGSGKTEASKKILEYVAACSTHTGDVDRVKNRLLKSNPILEAFGNAKTNRNDNSSRFGKYMDIQFDYKGAPVGGVILNYLLEKSRVCHQARGERNFHIFYQLLNGADEQRLGQLHLTGLSQDYFYLNQWFHRKGECHVVDTVDDKRDYKTVKNALHICDFSTDEQQALFSLVASILHLGNINFDEDNGAALIPELKQIQTITMLLGCDEEDLVFALTNRSIHAEGQRVSTPLNLDQAMYARDALAKGVYERLFKWLVNKLNLSLHSSRQKQKKAVLGLLDIYGFEIFEVNSFEQFCINYCNEKLQQLFIQLTLKSEQEEYLSEGIEWEPVKYFNNKVICDLVEAKPMGIIALMDEECLRPGDPTDATLLEKMNKNLSGHAHLLTYESATTQQRKSMSREEFQLLHYAGQVTYSVDGFLDKNNDLLYRDLKEVMTNTKNMISSTCFPMEEINSKKRPPTAGSQFKSSLAELMDILLLKEPSYIRCIKPNDNKHPAVFNEEIVRHQVKYLGLMENLRVRRAGFAYRRNYTHFLKRYKPLCPDTWPNYQGSDKDGVQVLCEHLQYGEDEYKMGRTKVFIRFPRTLFLTEDALQEKKHDIATLIQAVYRGFHQHTVYKKMQAAVTTIACYWKRLQAKRLLERRRAAAIAIRRFIKGFMTRKLEPNEENILFIQQMRRSFLMRLVSCLPKSVLDKSWPKSPEMLQETSKLLNVLNMRNMTQCYCKKITPEIKWQFEQKVAAEALFKGRKQSYLYSVREPFVSNRLGTHHESVYNSHFKANIKKPDEKIKYVAVVTKYDRHGYSTRSRVLVVSDMNLYLLNEKDFKLKDFVPFPSLKGISVSSLTDGLFVLHISTELNGNKGDIILHSDYIIEVLMKIVMAGRIEDKVSIVDDSIIHKQMNGKEGTIDFNTGVKYSISKSKTGHLAVVAAPII